MKKYIEFTNNEQINEGLFGFLKKMWDKAAGHIRKTKGGKEVQEIYDKYLKIITDEIQKKANVTLQLGAEEKVVGSKVKEGIILKYNQFLNEDVEEETDVDTENNKSEDDEKMTAKTLKEKEKLLDQILDTYRDKALREMENIMKKMGGTEKNPKLRIIIDNFKDDFKLKFLESKIKYLEKSGDKSAITKIAAERNKLAKDLEKRWNTLDEKGDRTGDVTKESDIIIGNIYQYKTEKDGIKNIEIVKNSDKDGEIIAKYLNKNDGKIEPQSFTIANIIIKPKVEVDKEYGYRSNKGTGKLIKVKVKKEPIDNLVEVSSENKPDETFKVNINLLRPLS